MKIITTSECRHLINSDCTDFKNIESLKELNNKRVTIDLWSFIYYSKFVKSCNLCGLSGQDNVCNLIETLLTDSTTIGILNNQNDRESP